MNPLRQKLYGSAHAVQYVNLPTCIEIVSMIRKYHSHKLQTNTWHREEEPHNNYETTGRQKSKATSSLLPIKMIAKLEWTQSNAQENIEQLQNPTMGVTINNESTTTEPPP